MYKQNSPSPKIKIGKYIDPLTDFGFKLLFGSEPHKDLLIAFLNELLKKRKEILDIAYNKNEHNGPQADYRNAVFDLTCTGKDGSLFIIEVQRIHQPHFKDRALYYASQLLQRQAPRGKEWDYNLTEVYFIGLMDFAFKKSAPRKYLHRVQLTEEGSKEIFYEKLRFIYIEIPKFNKREKMLKTGLDRWLYVLKNMSRLEKIPVILHKKIFEKLFHIATVANLTKEQYMRYEKNLMNQWDQYALLKAERERGIEEGIEKGIEKGLEKGIEKGIEEKSFEFVKNLLVSNKFSISEIANFADVSESFVRKVKKEIK